MFPMMLENTCVEFDYPSHTFPTTFHYIILAIFEFAKRHNELTHTNRNFSDVLLIYQK